MVQEQWGSARHGVSPDLADSCCYGACRFRHGGCGEETGNTETESRNVPSREECVERIPSVTRRSRELYPHTSCRGTKSMVLNGALELWRMLKAFGSDQVTDGLEELADKQLPPHPRRTPRRWCPGHVR